MLGGGVVVPIDPKGDIDQTTPLYQMAQVGVFVKKLEQSMLKDESDCAVHSLKDVPTELPEGLTLAAIPEIDAPRSDVVIMRPELKGQTLEDLPVGSRIGTSSLRRISCLRHKYAHKNFVLEDCRGNLNTRLSKIESGMYDAIILAAAGMDRLGWADKVSEYLDEETFLHAPGQGALAVECRANSAHLPALRQINHEESELRIIAERTFMRKLEGGCKTPIGVFSQVLNGSLRMVGEIWHPTEVRPEIRGQVEGELANAVQLGEELAQKLIDLGATAILDDIKTLNSVL